MCKLVCLNWDPNKVLSATPPDSIEWSSIPSVSYRLGIRSRALFRFMFDLEGPEFLGNVVFSIASHQEAQNVCCYTLFL